MLRNPFTPPCGFDLATTTVASPEGLASIAFWGHRLVVHPDGTCFMHETYYDAREGILGIAREPARPCGDSAADIRDALAGMRDGLMEAPLRFLDYIAEAPAGALGDGAPGGAPEPGIA